MIGITTSGDNNRTRTKLERAKKANLFAQLNSYGAMGVAALSSATPVDSSLTAQSWAYRVVQERNGPRVEWYNTNGGGGSTSIAILIQYGHGTRQGGYVVGRDYINPAIQPLFDQWVNEIWKKVMT